MVIAEGLKKISDALITIRDEYGESVIRDIPRLKALLSDFCPQYTIEGKIFVNVISDDALMNKIYSNADMSGEEVVRAIERRTGLAKEWALGVTLCLFKYLNRNADDILSMNESRGLYPSGVDLGKIQSPTEFFHAIASASNCVVQQVGAFSASQDMERICNLLGGERGKAIADILKREAPTYVREGIRAQTEIDVVNGMQFNRGFLSPYFATTDDSSIAVLEYPRVFIVDGKINSIPEILPLLEETVRENYKLLIIAEDLDEDVLKTLVVNKQRGTFSVVAVKSPGYGDRRKELLKDIAVLTGGFVYPSDQIRKIEDVTLDMLGQAGEVRVTAENTLISYANGDENKIKERIDFIKNEYDNSTSDFDREKLLERYENLKKGVTVLNVGGVSETEIKKEAEAYRNLMTRVQDALSNGLPEDISTYLDAVDMQLENKALSASEDEKIGLQIVRDIVKSMKS